MIELDHTDICIFCSAFAKIQILHPDWIGEEYFPDVKRLDQKMVAYFESVNKGDKTPFIRR